MRWFRRRHKPAAPVVPRRDWARLPPILGTVDRRPLPLIAVRQLPDVAGTRSLLRPLRHRIAGRPRRGRVVGLAVPANRVVVDPPASTGPVEPSPVDPVPEVIRPRRPAVTGEPLSHPPLTAAVDRYVGEPVSPATPFRSVTEFDRLVAQYSAMPVSEAIALAGLAGPVAEPPPAQRAPSVPPETPRPTHRRPSLAQSRRAGLDGTPPASREAGSEGDGGVADVAGVRRTETSDSEEDVRADREAPAGIDKREPADTAVRAPLWTMPVRTPPAESPAPGHTLPGAPVDRRPAAPAVEPAGPVSPVPRVTPATTPAQRHKRSEADARIVTTPAPHATETGAIHRAAGSHAPVAGTDPVQVAVPADVAGLVRTHLGLEEVQPLIHRGQSVSRRARALRARAFTQDGQVFLPDDAGPLDRRDTRALLVHELVHVAQQQALGSRMPTEDSAAGQDLEADAVAAEQWMLGAGPVPTLLRHRPRQTEPPNTVPPTSPTPPATTTSWSPPTSPTPAATTWSPATGPTPAAATTSWSPPTNPTPAATATSWPPPTSQTPAPAPTSWSPPASPTRAATTTSWPPPASPTPAGTATSWSPATGFQSAPAPPPAPVAPEPPTAPEPRTAAEAPATGPVPASAHHVTHPAPVDLSGVFTRLAHLDDQVAILRGRTPDPQADLDSPQELDRLAGKLYRHIRGRLRAELIVDRERAGLLADSPMRSAR